MIWSIKQDAHSLTLTDMSKCAVALFSGLDNSPIWVCSTARWGRDWLWVGCFSSEIKRSAASHFDEKHANRGQFDRGLEPLVQGAAHKKFPA
jgi:hypothetical protein